MAIRLTSHDDHLRQRICTENLLQTPEAFFSAIFMWGEPEVEGYNLWKMLVAEGKAFGCVVRTMDGKVSGQTPFQLLEDVLTVVDN